MWKVWCINTKTSKHNIWSHCHILTFPNYQISHENKIMLKFPKALFSLAFITNTNLAWVYPQTEDITQAIQRAPHFLKHRGSTGCDSTPVFHIVYHLFFFFYHFSYCNRTMPVQISADWTCFFTSPLPWADLDERIGKEQFTLCWHSVVPGPALLAFNLCF